MKKLLNDEVIILIITFSLAGFTLLGCMWLVQKDLENTIERVQEK